MHYHLKSDKLQLVSTWRLFPNLSLTFYLWQNSFLGSARSESVSSALKKWTTGVVDTSLDSIASLDNSRGDELDVRNEHNKPPDGSRSSANGTDEEDQGYKTLYQVT